MSWLFAITGKDNAKEKRILPNYERQLFAISGPAISLRMGGNNDTCFCESMDDGQSGWAVVGTGLRLKEDNASMLTRDDWANLLTREAFDPTSMDGHFIVLRWNGTTVELFADQLGLRTAYFGSCPGGICISTRPEWVTQQTGPAKIDFDALGSRWLMFNQVSQDSCIIGVKRLGPGGHALFRDGVLVRQRERPWSPAFEPASTEAARSVLTKFINCALDNPHLPSLGLSGGLDSRLLFALFLHAGYGRFTAHTFGGPLDPDVRIADQMAEMTGVPLTVFNDPLPGIDECVRAMRSFAVQTFLTEPSTSFFRLRYYPQLNQKKKMMIDGGFGEIARRQYLNRVVKLGKAALLSRNQSRLAQLMRASRADIFSDDIIAIMERGALRSLERAIEEMPDVGKIGIENFADLFAVRTRIPNLGSPEQARIDSHVLNFMPLVQPSFLNSIFGIPAKLRSNGIFHRSIIRSLSPLLTNLPLARSGITYRFGRSTSLAWLITRAKAAGGFGYSDPLPFKVLNHVREYVLDFTHSREIATSPFYDQEKINAAITQYFGGQTDSSTTVDWLLTFEFWRSGLTSSR